MALIKEPVPKEHITRLYFKNSKNQTMHTSTKLVLNEPGIQIMLKKKYLPFNIHVLTEKGQVVS